MKGIKFLIGTAAVAAVGAGATGLILNTKKAKMRRTAKKVGKIMYSVGNVLQTLSCQSCEI